MNPAPEKPPPPPPPGRSSTYRIGIVGAGFMGSVHAAGWAACDGAELTAIMSSPQNPPNELAAQYGMRVCTGLDELLGEVDVVDVCAPTHLHHDIVLAAAAAGRPVICEKPLARTPADGEQMITACRDAGVPLLVAHVVRFFPEYAAAHASVLDDAIGRPSVIRLSRATYLPSKPDGDWLADDELSGGLVLDLMVHDFDYARWVAGDVATVHARSVRASRPEAGTDHVLAIMKHRSGAISHVEGSWAHPPPTFRTRGEIAGTRGLLEFDSDRTAPVRASLRSTAPASAVPLPSSPLAEPPHTTQLRHFLAVLDGTAEPVVTADDGLAALRIASAAADSIVTGRPVPVEVAS
ncbi:gfo/Idh/MocA family oxidoreductase [Actinobacteria bacterium YIM 96077]|uniref:Gfo/Idh/MocA family oxidoreductase n=1 Tax=Phytoactinopolyspora halophila TaxID=1981511 RepID=A0A329QB97_9ACTN|nr:Gfo/Idh/MocA family oxidoreductase [Phytoactinopolyspora halophila]AYY12447.1 gfo/Idh/MocA family oxidoreductase [Actinobacteria bacterium YIM 96077]RAW09271.1 gfo/Idh/MocA family oxidoreductase [Phytoactinopolyspora halophila]